MSRVHLFKSIAFVVATAGLATACLSASVKAPQPEANNAGEPTFKFDFGSGKVAPGYIQVLPTTVYTKELGYGFEPGAQVTAVDRGGDDALRSDFITSDKPFYFSVALPEGNYRVTVTLGDRNGESTTTIKAELRRLMLENVHTAPGQFVTRTFMVNVRTPKIAGGGEVQIERPREDHGIRGTGTTS